MRSSNLRTFDVYGKLILLSKFRRKVGPCGRIESYWYAICECGKTHTIRQCSLTSGYIKSCGCLRIETAKKASLQSIPKTKKYYGNERTTQAYRTWRSMTGRVLSNKDRTRSIYKDRNIGVCDEWKDFFVFQKFAEQNGLKEGLTIDRIDNNRGYAPDNVRFVSMDENLKNRRPSSEWKKKKKRTTFR